jgi:hypothetical protein
MSWTQPCGSSVYHNIAYKPYRINIRLILTGDNWRTRKKNCPTSFCSPQFPQWLAWDGVFSTSSLYDLLFSRYCGNKSTHGTNQAAVSLLYISSTQIHSLCDLIRFSAEGRLIFEEVWGIGLNAWFILQSAFAMSLLFCFSCRKLWLIKCQVRKPHTETRIHQPYKHGWQYKNNFY